MTSSERGASPMLRDEYERNLEAIERAFPNERLLSKKQMVEYLMIGNTRTLKLFGINSKLTKESFAMRLTKGRKEN